MSMKPERGARKSRQYEAALFVHLPHIFVRFNGANRIPTAESEGSFIWVDAESGATGRGVISLMSHKIGFSLNEAARRLALILRPAAEGIPHPEISRRRREPHLIKCSPLGRLF